MENKTQGLNLVRQVSFVGDIQAAPYVGEPLTVSQIFRDPDQEV